MPKINRRNWPQFIGRWGCPMRKTSVRIESKDVYVDFPNRLIEATYMNLCNLGSKNLTPTKLRANVYKIVKQINTFLERGKYHFLSFRVVFREGYKKPVGVQYKVDWPNFENFLNGLQRNEDSLLKKYEYINVTSRFVGLQLGLGLQDSAETTKEQVLKFVKPNITHMKKDITNLDGLLSNIEQSLKKLSTRKSLIFGYPLSVQWYLPELRSSIIGLKGMVEKGNITILYREMRKIIESLSWCMIDDILFYNSGYYQLKKENKDFEAKRVYVYASEEWYKETKGTNIRGLKDFKNNLRNIEETILIWCNSHGKTVTRQEVRKTIMHKIGYPMLISLYSKEPTESTHKKIENGAIIVFFEKEELLFALKANLKEILKSIFNHNTLSLRNRKFVEELSQRIIPKHEEIVPCLPSNNFVLAFLDSIFSPYKLKLSHSYSKYSGFVHSYAGSWQVFPFSSVLEYKIANEELTNFTQTIAKLFDGYISKIEDFSKKR